MRGINNTFKEKEVNFIQGGSLRIFLQLLLQMIRKHKEGT